MAERLLSIDIREDVVTGVLLSSRRTGVAVLGCCLSVVGEGGFRASLEEVLRHIDCREAACRISFEAEQFFYRNLSLPFADKRKVEKILPIELEESIPLSMESLIVDSLVMAGREKESAVIAAFAEKTFLAERLEVLQELGLDPEIVAVSGAQCALQLARRHPERDFILLDCGCRRVTLFAVIAGKMRLVRPLIFDDGGLADFHMDKNSQFVSAKRPEKREDTFKSLAREIRRTLYALDDVDPQIPFVLTGPLVGVPESVDGLADALGNRVDVCDLLSAPFKVEVQCGLWRSDLMSSALALGLRRGRRQEGFNFRKETFARKISYERYKKMVPRLVAPLVILLIAMIGFTWKDYSVRQQELAAVTKEGEDIFHATIPGRTRIHNPVQQLQAEIRVLKKGMLGEAATKGNLHALDVMAEISTRIPSSISVHVVRMVADANSVLLRGLTDNFNSVDTMKKALEKSPYFEAVVINSANLATRDSGIRFELKLQMGGG